jgi:hypothetical protein
MEVREGFIEGVFNYCDRLCERCQFTAHCRLFADHAEIEAALDPTLKAVVDAPPLAEEVEPQPAWMRELIEETNDACKEPLSREERERIRPWVPPEHAAIDARARDYAVRTYRWLTESDRGLANRSDSPSDVISWFHFFIAAKINRALTIWPEDDPEDRAMAPDSNGSAKIALLAIERSHAAWFELVDRAIVPAGEANPFIADLVWLGEALERVRPNARAFVRPGFDEPEAVARLLAGQGGQR